MVAKGMAQRDHEEEWESVRECGTPADMRSGKQTTAPAASLLVL